MYLKYIFLTTSVLFASCQSSGGKSKKVSVKSDVKSESGEKEIQKRNESSLEWLKKVSQDPALEKGFHGNIDVANPFHEKNQGQIPIIRLTNTPFVDEKYPRLSHDGKMIVLESWLKEKSNVAVSINTINAITGLDRKEVLKNVFMNLRPVFNDDDNRLYYKTNASKKEFTTATLSLDGTPGTGLSLREHASHVVNIDVSSKGDIALAYYRKGKQEPSLGIIKKNGFHLPEIANGKNVSWSHSGERIIFVTSGARFTDIYAVDRDGNNLTQLTHGFGSCDSPSYSGDDSWVVFSAKKEKEKFAHLYLMKSDGTSIERISSGEYNHMNPCWSVDGWIYYESDQFDGNHEIMKISSSYFLPKRESIKFELLD